MSNVHPFWFLSNDAKRLLDRGTKQFLETLADMIAARIEQRAIRTPNAIFAQCDSTSVSADLPMALTMESCSKASGLSKSHLYAQMRVGALKSVKVAGRRLILRDDLEQFLRERRR